MAYKSNISEKYLDNIRISFVNGSLEKNNTNVNDIIIKHNRFVLPIDGKEEIVVNGSKYLLLPQNIYLFPAESKISAVKSNDFIKKYWFDFTAEVGDTNLFNIIRPKYAIHLTENSILNLFKTLLSLTSQDNNLYNNLAINSTILKIIAFYLNLDKIDLNSNSSKTKTDFRYVLHFIEQNIEQKISVNELAEVMHLHPNYFIRYFKSFYGISPIKFINNMRMDKAKQLLLAKKDFSISQIANQVGFDDILYFSKQFKKYNGCTPSEYRQINKLTIYE